MKAGVYDILKAKFLINEDAAKNWRFIVFLIAISHDYDCQHSSI
jgi:hypothetical protein